MIDRMQRELRSPPAAERGQRPHPFQSHEPRRIVHRWGEHFHRRIESVGPVADDPGRCRAGPRVGRHQYGLQKAGVDVGLTAAVEALPQPQGLQPQPLEIGIERIEGLEPRRQLRHHSRAAAGKEHPLRHVAGIALGRLEMPEQFGGRELREIDPRQGRPPLRRDPPDAAMRAVATVVAEVDLAMLDDWVVPVSDVDRAVGPHLHVDGAERHPLRMDQFGQSFTGEARAFLGEPEAADTIGPEVVRDELALRVVGQMTAVDDLEPAVFRAARIHAVKNARRARCCLIGRSREAVINPFAAGAVCDERPAPAVECMPPGVDPTAGEDIERERLWRKPPDAAGIEPPNAVGRLHMAVDIDRLVEVEPGIRPPAEGVDDVVRVFRAEAGENDPSRVGLAVTIGVGEVKKLRAVGDVDTAVAGQHGGGHQEAVGKDRAGVGLPVTVAILEDRNGVVGDLARPDLWIHARRRDPQPALGIEVHLQGLRDQRIGSEEIHFIAIGHLHRRQFRRRVRRGDVFEAALGQRGLQAREREADGGDNDADAHDTHDVHD